MIVTSLYNGHSHLHQLSVIRIAEGREEQPHALGGEERGGGAD